MAAFIASTVLLIALYSRTVDLRHEMTENKTKLQAIEASNGERKGELLAALDTHKLEQFAASRQLVREVAPQYLAAAGRYSWAFASH